MQISKNGCCSPCTYSHVGPLPVRYQSGCCSPAPIAIWGPYLYDIRADAGPTMYDIIAAVVALHLQPQGPLSVRYQSGCCSPAPTATGAPTCTISERLL
ncbi:hypothetical protein RRG08_055799 [Elysia crispata]|uniref:Uncharacterized protein n=1 Tax=Elysia crispata TaxID=231223 RepID=A0AAE1E8B6_9GAST|nr:hypothetical protein RRG08_055799 [Elysia crispata]